MSFPEERHVKKKAGWREIPEGGNITAAGSSLLNKTGSWRTFRPVWEKSKCINCMICYVYCPENCITAKDRKLTGVNYDYCKGCGICSRVCPVKCYTMVEEAKAKGEENAAKTVK